MAGASSPDSLERLQNLYRDLQLLAESTVPNVERLCAELEAQLQNFRTLLEKEPANGKSREDLHKHTIRILDADYQINDDFKQGTIEVADALNLDELKAAALYLEAQETTNYLDRSATASSIIIFHQKRQFLLECLNISLQRTARDDLDDPLTTVFQELVTLIFQTEDGRLGSGSEYWRRCLKRMQEIEKWLVRVNERIQSTSMTGQTQSSEAIEVMALQRESLGRQHEILGAIASHLVRANYTNIADLHLLLDTLKAFDRVDSLVLHYIPMLVATISRFGPSSADCVDEEGKKLRQRIVIVKDGDNWSSRGLQAVASAFWLAWYSARYSDQLSGAPSSDVGTEAQGILETMMESLKDGAFHLMLGICQDINSSPWLDPFRRGLASWLLQNPPVTLMEQFEVSLDFRQLLSEYFQNFAEALITNMPDILRKLKLDEDEQRRIAHGRIQLRPAEYELHLERFYVIMSYAYEDAPAAAESFWIDPENNLYGFLQWASQRQTTPRVAAFCEMLRGLSQDDTSANAAHRFLLDDGGSTTRLRRNSPLSWTHIFRELEYYSSTVRDRPTITQSNKSQIESIPEPESAMMLECYLRLIHHLCQLSNEMRIWLLEHPSFHIQEHLLLLCGSSIDSRLRACAINALSALLTGRERETRDTIWAALDGWVFGGQAAFGGPNRPAAALNTERMIFDLLSVGFEEPEAFVHLLLRLVSPPNGGTDLNDTLPFPESLGSAYRMPGIDSYVDFVMDRVFAAKSVEIQDEAQLRLIRLSCLDFAVTCFSTFNEDLVLLANKSSLPVDEAMKTSSLLNYVRLHPFGRLMEWFFNDGVIIALFATLTQDVQAISNPEPNSPFILSLLRGLEVVLQILNLQSTYFDLVRPKVKLQATSPRTVVANSAFASFEDAILTNPELIPRLWSYCGCGHEQVSMSALRLLRKLGSARKLAAPIASSGKAEKSRLVIALEREGNAESISRSLISIMAFDERELEWGPSSPGFIIKNELLNCLNGCIDAIRDRPSMAHALLGFTCFANAVDVASGTSFAEGNSLFHAIVRFVIQIPITDANGMAPWLLVLKRSIMTLLHRLWSSPMTSNFILSELRGADFLLIEWLNEPVINETTIWDGRTILDQEYQLSDSATALASFITNRAILFAYAAAEVRALKTAAFASIENRVRSALLGGTVRAFDQEVRSTSVLEFMDFLELDGGDGIPLLQSRYFDTAELNSLCAELTGPFLQYNVANAGQYIQLKANDLENSGKLENINDKQQAEADAQNILQCMIATNNRASIKDAQSVALKAWAQLVVVILEVFDIDESLRISFIFQGLQIVLARLEVSFTDGSDFAIELARLCRAFMLRLNAGAALDDEHTASNPSAERLSQLFRIGLNGIQAPESSSSLRAICYEMCQSYIRKVLAKTSSNSQTLSALGSVKSYGMRLIEVICEDAYAGEDICKVPAILLLNGIVAAGNATNPSQILEAFDRINYIRIVLDSVKSMQQELQNTANSAQLLTFYDANLALLLRICQTRAGAAVVMNSGFFQVARECGLFSADPDVGIDIDNPKSLSRYFTLLLSMLQVINAVVLSRGLENEHTTAQARGFLQDHRAIVKSIFKRNAKIGNFGGENEQVLDDLADGFTTLIAATNFLEFDGEKQLATDAPRFFS